MKNIDICRENVKFRVFAVIWQEASVYFHKKSQNDSTELMRLLMIKKEDSQGSLPINL